MQIIKHFHSSLSLLIYLTPHFLSNVWCQFCNTADDTLTVSSDFMAHVEIHCIEDPTHQLKGTFLAQLDGQDIRLQTLFKYRCSNSTHVLVSDREMYLSDVDRETVDVSDLPEMLTGKVTCTTFGCYERRDTRTNYRLDPSVSNNCSFDPPVPLHPPPIPTSIVSSSSLINPSSWSVVTTSMSLVAISSHPVPIWSPFPVLISNKSLSTPTSIVSRSSLINPSSWTVVTTSISVATSSHPAPHLTIQSTPIPAPMLIKYLPALLLSLAVIIVPGLVVTCVLAIHKRKKKEKLIMDMRTGYGLLTRYQECITDGLSDLMLLKTYPSAVSIIEPVHELTEKLMVEKPQSLKSDIDAEIGANDDLDVNVHTDIEASIAAVHLVGVTSEDYDTTYVQVANAQETYLSNPTSFELDTSSTANAKESDFSFPIDDDDQEQISFEPYFETLDLEYHEAATDLTMPKEELSRCLSMPSLQSQDNSKSAARDSYVRPLIYTSHADIAPDCVDTACDDHTTSGKVREGYLPHLPDLS